MIDQNLQKYIKEETDKVSYLKENLESMTEIKDTIKNKESIEKAYRGGVKII